MLFVVGLVLAKAARPRPASRMSSHEPHMAPCACCHEQLRRQSPSLAWPPSTPNINVNVMTLPRA